MFSHVDVYNAAVCLLSDGQRQVLMLDFLMVW
jgi:hypothetical protein